MTEFYAPATKKMSLPGSGRSFQLRRGIHNLPDELTMHADANGLGIKPVGEMTDAEWKALGYTPAQRAEIEDRNGLVAKAEPGPDPEPAKDETPVPEVPAKPAASPVTPVSVPASPTAPATVTVAPTPAAKAP